ncbi:MAG: hypothetical protein ACI959_001014 [Limisphaerales bacterium]|jgi:hypothetical protein
MSRSINFLLIFVFFLTSACLQAQVQGTRGDTVISSIHIDTLLNGEVNVTDQTDTLNSDFKPDRHSPTKAAWKSAVIPGWGQVYNDKYWKVPIVYGGLGGLGYWIYFNADNHNQYRQAIIAINDEDSTTLNPFGGTESTLINTREIWRRQLDLSIIFFAAFYGLQIVDAVVDAHLYEFDVSDDLTIRWKPEIDPFRYRNSATNGNSGFYGLNLQLDFGGN